MSVSPHLLHLVKDSVETCSSVKEQEVSNSVIEGEFAFNNCVDIHVGPKNEHNTNIVINQNISVSSEEGLSRDLSGTLKERLGNLNYGAAILQHPINICFLQVLPITVATFFLTLIITIIVILFIANVNNSTYSKVKNENENERPSPEEQQDKVYPIDLKFVSRENWGAAQPLVESMYNELPVRRIIFIHTAGAGTCNKYSACKQQVQGIQEMHMDPSFNFGDIGYNFVLGSDGYIYVGVGWDKVGAHTQGFNRGSLGVAFIGDFRRDVLNNLMITSAKRFLEFGVRIKKISDDYQLFGHCQIHYSFPLSPGKNIIKEIKTWDHWNSTNINKCAG